MATMPASIPHFLLPRFPMVLRRAGLPVRTPMRIRHSSATAATPPPAKSPPTLAKPDKYRPPSHGRSLPRSITEQKSYGPKITKEEKERMAKKKYPNMMSPVGTFSHWFINSRWVHVCISTGILVGLSTTSWWLDFYHKTVYQDLLPSKKDFWEHPIETTRQIATVYKMHLAFTTQEVMQNMLKDEEDAAKRKAYRKAKKQAAEERGEIWVDDPRYVIGEDGKRRRRVKKWFGVWE